MSLLSPFETAEQRVDRIPLHHRRIELRGFRRLDGLWDIEGELFDVKHYDYNSADGTARRAGEPVHLMKVRLTVDESMTLKAIKTLRWQLLRLPSAGVRTPVWRIWSGALWRRVDATR